MSRDFTDSKTKQSFMCKTLDISKKCDKCHKYTYVLYPNYEIDADPGVAKPEFGECEKCYFFLKKKNGMIKLELTKDEIYLLLEAITDSLYDKLERSVYTNYIEMEQLELKIKEIKKENENE